MKSSTEIINKAKERFEELMDKDFEWRSFYNGFLEGYSFNFFAENKLKEIVKLFDELAELSNQTREEAIKNYLGYYQSKNKV
jgi:hypothetical protein